MLRRLLGSQLQRDPASLEFSAGAHGKPRLAGVDPSRGLEFNLSHSGDQALLGCAWGRELGVDIEMWRSLGDEAALVQRYFSPAEQHAYASLPPSARTAGFFQCWTRKEAYIKAVGRGLGLPLDSFDVSLGDGVPVQLLRASEEDGGARQWSLAAADVGPAASAAVVLAAGQCQLFACDV
ncbi:MAG TPA: 4'-phosphopantetheinyl transferase superfamily protein [Steroidobacteraceae bacterium]|nr:4'-phosphopantetheinyl transferase superfamily protein [Steroidobacteraceae bacterium]